MSEVVISVENLSKIYRLGTIGTGTLSHDLNRFWHRLRGKEDPYLKIGQVNDSLNQTDSDYVWALRDINLEVKQGEVLGIIGRNGAGKSTLLKILSKITAPSKGLVKVKGRIASLLEVGTGFHPELTGRENIFLNGAILGMRKVEIREKFDEILDFSGVERYIDTPVKRYSSGMYVRLAFAVAAFLDPDILIVDEVLAVGDISFQKKCLTRMATIANNQARTILFVSHQMNAISSLCNSCLLIESGRVAEFGKNVDGIVSNYFLNNSGGKNLTPKWISINSYARSNPYFQPLKLFLTTDLDHLQPHEVGVFKRNNKIYLIIEAKVQFHDPSLTIGYDIFDEGNNLVYRTYHTDGSDSNWPKIEPPSVTLVTLLPAFLNEGIYRIALRGSLHFREWLFSPSEDTPTIHFQIKGGLSDSPYWYEKRQGLVAPIIEWKSFRN